ncbi:hypothetical protein AB0K18_26380 [Nonomuraea sp. NPDC049421]|uniref:hypothetical protein n=1 Tax=Nonomuraea sp. NPDC049421 TaxID=3155275 RepID=UPI00342230E0
MMSVGLARKAAAFGASTAALAALAAGLVAGPAQAATAAKPASKAKVSATTPKAAPGAYEGSCPVKVNFSAKIKVPVKGSTKVAYRWLHGDGSKSKVKTVTVKGKGTRTVTVKQSITFTEDVKKGWEAVQVLGPKKVTSKKGYFSVNCQSLKEVERTHLDPTISARAWASPSSYAGRCAPGARIGFTGVISSSRPAWVRYRWVVNGDAVDYGKIKVRDSRKVGFSISPRHSQRGWAQLQVLSPDSASSNRAYYKVWCKDYEAPKPHTKVSASAHATTGTDCSVRASGSVTSTGAGRVTYRWSLNGRTVSDGSTYFGRDGGTIVVPGFSTALSGHATKGGVVTLSITGPDNSDSSSDRYAPCKPEPKPTTTPSPKNAEPEPGPTFGDAL